MSRYRNCSIVSNDNEDGIEPVRLFVDSHKVTKLDAPLNAPGIDPRRLFVLISSNVNDVKRPIDVGRLPVRPAPDRLTDTTTPPLHVTLFHDDVDGPVHTLPVAGYAPLHCQLMYAARLLAPVAADKSHIMLSWYCTIDGDAEGTTEGDTDGDCDGAIVGTSVGLDVVGDLEGDVDGAIDGDVVGDVTGVDEGCDDGDTDGDTLGADDGINDGAIDGDDVGVDDGDALGDCDGCDDGADDGPTLGDTDGDDDGALVHDTNPDPKFFVALGVKHDA